MSSISTQICAPRARTARIAGAALAVAITGALLVPMSTASAQTAQGALVRCPDGAKPVPATDTKPAHCAPSRLTAAPAPTQDGPGTGDPGQGRDTPAQGAIVRCPDGAKPVPATARKPAHCAPSRLSAAPSPTQDGPGTGDPGQGRDTPAQAAIVRCPDGARAVPATDKKPAHCAPSRLTAAPSPTQDGPGTGDPGQGRDNTAQLVARDLALVESFRIGATAMEWGTSATLLSSAAAFKQAGACGFRYSYRTRNVGGVGTAATTNRIHRDAANGAVLATAALPGLAPSTYGTSSGHVLLKPGTWMLYAQVDATGQIAESNEANNLRRVRVTVTGSCAG